MKAIQPRFETSVSKDTWPVVVLYDDALTRERAMRVCDHLAQQFWREVEFQFHWWRTDFLEDSGMAAAAAENAIDAEFIIVSCASEIELAPTVRHWFEQWIGLRSGLEGALVDLTKTGTTSPRTGENTKAYLREVARRAEMDYLNEFPSAISGALPDSFETVGLRAAQVTSVLDDILRQSPPPSHFGLNE